MSNAPHNRPAGRAAARTAPSDPNMTDALAAAAAQVNGTVAQAAPAEAAPGPTHGPDSPAPAAAHSTPRAVPQAAPSAKAPCPCQGDSGITLADIDQRIQAVGRLVLTFAIAAAVAYIMAGRAKEGAEDG